MPQVLHVGYRSPLVTTLAWLLTLLALAGLGLFGYLIGFGAVGGRGLSGLVAPVALAAGSLLLGVGGQGLLRRFEWGRRLSMGLLLALMLALPALPWLTDSSLALAVLSLLFSAAIVWPLRALDSLDVRQEFA